MKGKFRNLQFEKFGMLRVTCRLPGLPTKWECCCDCGRVTQVLAASLVRAKHPTRTCGKHYANSFENAHLRRLVARVKKRAKTDSITLTATDQQLAYCAQQPCTYCGTPAPEKLHGIDRIDNNQGYETSNITSCCWICNRAKGTLPFNQWVKWITRLMFFNAHKTGYKLIPLEGIATSSGI